MKTLHYEIDIEQLRSTIDNALKLEDNASIFNELSTIAKAKKEVSDLLEAIEKIEREAKGAINAKAKALYGIDWSVIKGDGYKIIRYFGGDVYAKAEGAKISPKFTKIIEKLDTEAITAYLEEKQELPDGLELNSNRSEIVRVTVNANI